MRRLPVLAALALLAAGLVAGTTDSATAAKKPPPFSVESVTLVASEAQPGRCVLTVSWAPSEPERVASYLVQGNNAPLRGKNTVQGSVVQETTSSYTIDDDSPFYVDVTINYVDGRDSKPFSVGDPAWSCLG
jgi:hypothetical protein